ncbi:MAG: hypothetical protein NWR97_05710 [Salibacteraceae bacterium]|nr:hypothetical protein [Salibacteraceae bacterium]
MKKILASLALVLVVFSANAQLAKLVGKAFTKKTDDLSKMSVTIGYEVNLYSPEEKTLTSKYAKEDWKEGASMVGIVIMKKDGAGLYELEGSVTIDGKPAKYYGLGSYMLIIENDDLKPKKIVIKSDNGKSFEYMVSPSPMVKFKSVNGQTSGTATIDLQQDLAIDLDVNDQNKNHLVSLGMLVGVPGGKDYSLFAVARAKDKLLVPHQAVSTKQIAGGGISGKTNIIDFKDDNLLRIESFDEIILENTPFGAARVLTKSYDHFDVEVKGKDKGVNYIKVDGKTDKDHGKFEYFAQKPSNFYAPALKNIESIGVASLNVSGVLFKKETTESSYTSGNMRYTTVTTTTWQFPKLDDAYWNQLLENVYQSLNQNFTKNYGMTFTEVDKITAHPEYRSFYTPSESNTEKLIQKSYKDTKRLQPASLMESLAAISSTYTKDLPEYKLLTDLGLDAVMMITVDLPVSDASKKKVVLDPVVTFKILGNQLSYGNNPMPVIAEGTVSGRGVPFKMKQFNDLNALTTITQWDNLLFGINAALKDLQELEEQEKYYQTWQLLE